MSPDSAEDTVEFPLVKGPYDQEESKTESVIFDGQDDPFASLNDFALVKRETS